MTSPSSITALTPLARGGMAELHVGRMQGIAGVEQLVVVKRILPSLAHRTDFVEMFISEARVSATLQHPNIVQTYNVGEDDEGYYITMEYLQGADLRRILTCLAQEKTAIPQEFALQIIIGVLAGLHYAHERTGVDGQSLNIVHRDVSPHNAYVTWDGAVKLLDFGVAKASNNLNPDEDLVQGKLRYMSPEQVLNAPIDRRTDVYAAGVMLYELLTGHRAHAGKARADIQRAIIDLPVRKPAELGIKLPEELEQILLRSLRKKRAERFQTARDFQSALEDFCQSRGIYPSPIRLGEWVQQLVPTPQSSSTANRTGSLPQPKQAKPDKKLRSTAHAELRQVAGVTVVHLRGRLNEGFDGRAVGEQLDGPVVLDLDGVERITSFGIRSWLEMLKVSCAKPLYIARMPTTFLNQVGMVRGLLGKGKVVSFYLPFLCPEDQAEFRVLVEGKAAKRMLDFGDLPKAACPRDSTHKPNFDEDFDLFDVLADDFLAEPPSAIVGVLAELDSARDLPPIEKVLEGDVTTFHIRRSLDDSLRWKRLLDGLEGDVIFDLNEVTSTSTAGIDSLVRALRVVAPDLRTVTLAAGPREFWDALFAAEPIRSKLLLESLVVPATCSSPTCADHGLIRSLEAHPPRARGGDFTLESCRSCMSPMEAQAGTLTDVPGFGAKKKKAPAKKAVPAQRRGCLPGFIASLFGG